jgi:hypothetical protein
VIPSANSPVPVGKGACAKPRGIAGKDPGGSESFDEIHGEKDWVAAVPVSRELVSLKPISLLTGKRTGNFVGLGFSHQFQAEFCSYFPALTREFPADRNREFFEAEQGTNSREQGI